MRLHIILWAVLELTAALPSELVDPNCGDYDLSLICVTECDDEFMQCIGTCSDSTCVSDCQRVSVTCIEACPCHTDCLEGCKGCENPICFCNDETNDDNLDSCFSKNSNTLGQCILDCNGDSTCEGNCVSTFKNKHSECPCQDKCPLGCPCDGYDCDLPDKKAILVLNSYSSNQPLLIQPNGGVTENFKFQLGDDTEAYWSCSAILNDELFVFGGTKNKKQVSRVIDCGLKRIGDLTYDFYQGTCGTYSFPQERIMLCFAQSFNAQCESYDGLIFHRHADSIHGHSFITLANNEGSPLAIGSYSPDSKKSETYDIASNTWTEIADYPYHAYIGLFATVTTEQGALIIGGWANGSNVPTVACYKAGWSKLDDLQSSRHQHRAIVNGDKVYVTGGSGNFYTEIWSLDEKSKNIKLADPRLTNYYGYSELFIVDTKFCVKP